jgi:hypothetical protein
MIPLPLHLRFACLPRKDHFLLKLPALLEVFLQAGLLRLNGVLKDQVHLLLFIGKNTIDIGMKRSLALFGKRLAGMGGAPPPSANAVATRRKAAKPPLERRVHHDGKLIPGLQLLAPTEAALRCD